MSNKISDLLSKNQIVEQIEKLKTALENCESLRQLSEVYSSNRVYFEYNFFELNSFVICKILEKFCQKDMDKVVKFLG
jgi:hypothetical protein